MRKEGFIPEIEGLRAIAILTVIVNHFDPILFPGGYLGVDLFFVISGFVVSKSLDAARIDSLKTYLVEFYSKRIRRLFPALLVSLVLITLAGTFLLGDLGKSTTRTAATSLIGFSNLFLIKINTDYFGLGSEFNLFLPTWSLGVEEQFYLLFPLILFWIKSRRKSLFGWLTTLFVVSFGLFVTFHFLSKNVQYYFPFTRLWELLLGALAYFYTKGRPVKLGKFLLPLFAAVLAVIFAPNIFSFPNSYDFFSIAAPLVCMATALLLVSTVDGSSRVLNNPLFLYIGKLSYSMYLYHFAVLKLINPGPSLVLQVAAVAILTAVSMLSYHFIETPVRESGKLRSVNGRGLLAFGTANALVVLLVFVQTRHSTEKDPFMHPSSAAYPIGQCNFYESPEMKCRLPSENNPQLFFVGDSHSNALTPVMVELNHSRKFEVYSLSSNGLFTTTMNGFSREHLNASGKKDAEFIFQNARPGSTVIVTNQLMTWFSRTLNDDPEQHRLTFEGKLLSQREALDRFISEKAAFADELRKKKINLVITAPFPDFKLHPAKCYSPLKILMKYDSQDSRCETSRLDQIERRKEIVQALEKLAAQKPNVKIFDPIDLVCNGAVCASYKDNIPVYYDDDHINFNLSPYLVPKLYQALTSI